LNNNGFPYNTVAMPMLLSGIFDFSTEKRMLSLYREMCDHVETTVEWLLLIQRWFLVGLDGMWKKAGEPGWFWGGSAVDGRPPGCVAGPVGMQLGCRRHPQSALRAASSL